MKPEEVAQADGYIAQLERQVDSAERKLQEMYNIRNHELGDWNTFLIEHRMKGKFRAWLKERETR